MGKTYLDYDEKTTPADADWVLIWDVAAGNNKKVSRTNFFKDPPMGDKSVDSTALKSTVAFSATSVQSTTAGEVDITTFTETFDVGANFDHTTGIFTAPVNGVYSFKGQFGRLNNTARVHAFIMKNGAYIGDNFGFAYGAGNGNADPTAITVPLLNLVAGDEINLRGWAESGTAAAFNCVFSGYLVGGV